MNCLSKRIGVTVVAFGLGILLASFLPAGAVVVVEALVIVSAGICFIKKTR